MSITAPALPRRSNGVPARFDAGQQRRRSLIAKVHVAKKQLGLADDDYQAVLIRITGHASAGDCNAAELVAALKEFERLGFAAVTPGRTAGKARPADHPVARKARALWISLHQLGVVRNPSEQALEAFACAQLKVAKLQWANQSLGYRLIEALKAMAERAGWSQDLTGVKPGAHLLVLKRRLVETLFGKLRAAGLIAPGWNIDRAAREFGGLELDGFFLTWGVESLDQVAAVFATTLHAAKPPASGNAA